MGSTALVMDLVASIVGDSVTVGPTYDEERATPGETYVAVTLLPGEGDVLSLYPIFDVGVFSPRYAVSERVAFDIDKGLMGYPFRVGSGGTHAVVDSVNIVSTPAEVEWDGDASIRRFVGTYQLVIRR